VIREDIKKKIVQAVRKSVGVCAGNAFYKSQMKVPVVTGDLRDSGTMKPIMDGVEIKYSQPYASEVERGVEPGMVHVPAYTKHNGTHVRSYDYFSKGQKAQHYIEEPMKESFDNLNEEITKKLDDSFVGISKVVKV
jgi:hypothetical protein